MTAHRWQAPGLAAPLFALLARDTFWRVLGWLALSALLSPVSAQPGASVYYQQCLRFEALGDLQTARQSCLNALELNASSVDTKLALARLELALGNAAAAETHLNEILAQTLSAEPHVLLAEAALAEGRTEAAAGFLNAARERLSQNPNSALEGRFYFVEGKLAAARGDYGAARRAYQSANAAEPLDRRYPLALAELLFELGDTAGARREIETYQTFSSSARDPQNASARDPALLSLLGRVKWAQSDLSGAVSDLETAVALRGSENADAQVEDLRALALVYYGQGDVRAGGLALRAALRRGTLLLDVLNRLSLWAFLLVGLLALHLLGESRVVKSTLPPDPDPPKTWTLTQVYAVLGVALVLSLSVAFVYGVLRYENYLAFLTPLQSGDLRALFFACFGAFLFLFTVLRTVRNGLDPVATLLGDADKVATGAFIGLGLVVVTLLYLGYSKDFLGKGVFYLDFSRLTPTLVAAAVLVPLSEVFFRAFAQPPLQERYPRHYGVLVSGTLFALVFASPALLLLAIGFALAAFFHRTGSGLAPLVASLVFHLGLVVGVALLPWVRQLFV